MGALTHESGNSSSGVVPELYHRNAGGGFHDMDINAMQGKYSTFYSFTVLYLF